MKKNLQQLFEEYTNEIKFSACLRPETIRGYRNVFHLFLKVMPEVSTTENLTPEMLNEFFKRIHTRIRIIGRDTSVSGVKKSTIKTQRSKLNVFFTWLHDKGYLGKNPLKDIPCPKVIYDDSKRLENSDIHKIYSAITQYSSNSFILRRDTFMVSLFLYCGIRRGEFISLQVRDIDIEKKEITIRKETSKSEKTKVLKIHPTLMLHLMEYLKERKILNLKTEYLIASSMADKGLSDGGLKHWTESIKKKSGVDFHVHCFRHTFAAKLAEADVGSFKIQKMMGHSSTATTQRYVCALKTQDMAKDISKISFNYLFSISAHKCLSVKKKVLEGYKILFQYK